MGFFTGSKAKNYQQSLLTKQQQPVLGQLTNAAQQSGAGGAFGGAADYYRDLLSDDSQTFNAMKAPEMRQFNEDIIPGISEQFAGAGSGGLSSSGFRNAAVNAGTDLSERLGAIRAQLRGQGAAGLAGIGQSALGQYSENIHQPATGGFLDAIAPAIGAGIGAATGGWASGGFQNPFGGKSVSKGSDWTGGMPQAPGKTSGNYGFPTFLNR